MILFSNHIRGKSFYNENRNKSVHMFLFFFFQASDSGYRMDYYWFLSKFRKCCEFIMKTTEISVFIGFLVYWCFTCLSLQVVPFMKPWLMSKGSLDLFHLLLFWVCLLAKSFRSGAFFAYQGLQVCFEKLWGLHSQETSHYKFMEQ